MLLMNMRLRKTKLLTSFDKQTDDFPPGAYSLKTSKAARIIMSVMKTTVESELDEYLFANKKVTIKITGSTDGSAIKNKIPYNNEFGELIDKECADSREKFIAFTSLETAVMWANASVARTSQR